MSEYKTTAPFVTRVENKITVEWDVIAKTYTAYELITIERNVSNELEITGRGYVNIPAENVGLIMSLVAELFPEAVAK